MVLAKVGAIEPGAVVRSALEQVGLEHEKEAMATKERKHNDRPAPTQVLPGTIRTTRWPAAAPLRHLLIAVLILAGVAMAAWFWVSERRTETLVPDHTFLLQASHMGEWKAMGGGWEFVDGTVRSNSSERGAKLVAGSDLWDNYTLSSDIRFDGAAADMGVIVRSNHETEGTDAYNGYFVGLRSLDGSLVIGRANYGAWVEARPVPMLGGVSPSVWYRLRVTAYGCHIAASVLNLATQQTAWVAFEERFCVKSGRIGLRSLNANGMWRNVNVQAAGWNDYLELQRHATSVEQPVVFAGPPWWTPWHVGTLFGSVLALALVAQLVYFRMQQWRALAITQERERLAHEIHDTMAQSFAGVGYQIQGIRRSVIRRAQPDSTHIAEQLSVAYQLVRKCHEEASRTIAMFSAPLPLTQQNLLEELAKTARKIAGSQLEIVTRLEGTSTSLTLRLTDALLHIGQEAIANAVSHSDPTQLTIILRFADGCIELIIQDNGYGMDYTPAKAGFGILAMQKRARAVKGRLEIESVLRHGTTVSVRAELQQQQSPRKSRKHLA